MLVAIGLSDIALAPEAERIAHARAIRQRVRELESRFGVRMPVYLLLTKADLIAGFSEFFAGLDRERRGQVWGTTFPLETTEAGPAGLFGAEFRALVGRLDDQLLTRLQEERGADQRAMIAGFPAQIASLEQPLAAFIQEAFGGSRLERAPMLRGVYLTSAAGAGSELFSGGIVAGCDLRRGDAGVPPAEGGAAADAAAGGGVRLGRASLRAGGPDDVAGAERRRARHRGSAGGLGGV